MKTIFILVALLATAQAATISELCDVATAQHGMPTDAHAVCTEVGTAAVDVGVDPLLAIAIALKESHFRTGRDGDGGRSAGPLQVIPYYQCPGRELDGCDLVVAGVTRMFKLQEMRKKTKPNRWHKIKPHEFTAYHIACHYKGGNRCGTGAKASAYRVVMSMRKLLAGALSKPSTKTAHN